MFGHVPYLTAALLFAGNVGPCVGNSGSGSGYFWQITDVHVDGEYNATAGRTGFCRGAAVQEEQEAWWGRNGCGLPWRTVQSAVQLMQREQPRPDFIVWTGDTAPYWPYPDWSHVFPKLQRVTQLLQQAFPNTPILPVIGNHDAHPSDQLPADNSTFYRQYLQRSGWQQLLDPEARDTFSQGGYYLAQPTEQLRVLALNTNLYYGKNELVDRRQQDPAGQLAWLQRALTDTNSSADLVIAHISPGFPHWSTDEPNLAGNFNSRMLQALAVGGADRRLGHLFGHEHLDTFQIVRNADKFPVQVFFMSPAMYPGSGRLDSNPGVRLFRYSDVTLQDFSQYHLDLKAANLAHRQSPEENADASRFWSLTYKFSELYGSEDLQPTSVLQAYEELRQNRHVFDTYWNLTNGRYSQLPCDDKCHRSRLCTIGAQTRQQMQQCQTSASGRHGNAPMLSLLSVLLIVPVILWKY